jgi:thioesterase domain-containing protein
MSKEKNTSTPLLYRLLNWIKFIAQALVLLLLSAFLLNWLLSTLRIAQLRADLASDPTLRHVVLPSATVPLHVRCELAKGATRRATLLLIAGAGGSWIYNALPVWPLSKLVPGLEVCSFARQGYVFSDGWHDNATAVDAISAQTVELIAQITDPSLPLFIAGHSYGGVQAPLVAQRILAGAAGKRAAPSRLFLFDPSPAFVDAAHRARMAELLRDLAQRLRVVEVASSLGLLRAFESYALDLPQFSNALAEIPPRYHDAWRYAFSAQQTYKGLCADLERVNVTVEALNAAIKRNGASPLLGDVPIDIVYASRPRFDPPTEELEAQMVLAEKNSLYDSLSSAVHRSTIEGADHMFHSSSEVILKVLKVIVSGVAPVLKASAAATANAQ